MREDARQQAMDDTPRPRRIVIGQKAAEGKVALARFLRKNMTVAERRLWQQLRSNRLAELHFRRKQVISGLIVDFYCHAARLAVEVDGPVHDADYDTERDRILTAQGIAVMRFSNDEVLHDTDDVLRRILHHLEKNGSRET